MEELSHLDKEGNVKMVDVTNKISNNRVKLFRSYLHKLKLLFYLKLLLGEKI